MPLYGLYAVLGAGTQMAGGAVDADFGVAFAPQPVNGQPLF